MIVDIDPATSSCSLLEPDGFTGFHAQSSDADAAIAGAAMGPAGHAADEPEHVWVAIGWLVETAAGSDAWRASFDGMVQYAISKGWTNQVGTHIKAHVEAR